VLKLSGKWPGLIISMRSEKINKRIEALVK